MSIGKAPDAIIVHITFAHACGQVIEQVLHLKMDEAFSVGFSAAYPPLSVMDVVPFTVQTPGEKLDLSGHIGVKELNGIEWRDGLGAVCQKCGAGLLFPEKA
jgi:hypothetical protein